MTACHRRSPATRALVAAIGIAAVVVQTGTARVVPSATVRARPRLHSVTVSYRARQFVIPFDTIVDAFAITDARILAASTRGDTAFVILTLSGPSRSPEGAMGYCGAGEEGYAVLATLPPAGPPGASFTRISSCFHNYEPEEWSVGKDSVIGGWWAYTTTEVHMRAVYLPRTPERGLILSVVP